MEPNRTTVKRLFALSRNLCAFPECSTPIVEGSGTVTGILCHIQARSRGGPRYSAKQTEEQRHAFENLVLMCSRHSKVIDSEPKLYTVQVIEGFKTDHEQPTENELSVVQSRQVDLILNAYRDTYITATNVFIKSVKAHNITFTKGKGGPTIAAPEGSIGSDLLMRNYTDHLITRYNEFASKQKVRKGGKKFTWAAIHSHIKKEYKVGKWELVPITKFAELCTMLQKRIDETQLGCTNRGKGYRNYSTLAEYRTENFAP